MVPLSAHALFARPLVVGPESALAVEMLDRTEDRACSGATDAAPSTCRPARAWSCARSSMPVRLARLHPAAVHRRSVNKFSLPVAGWRGPGPEEKARP